MAQFGQGISLKGPKGDLGPGFLTTKSAAPTVAGYEGQGAVDTEQFVIYTYTAGQWIASASFRGLQGVAGSNAMFLYGQGAPTTGNPAVPAGQNAIYLQANGEIWLYEEGGNGWVDTGENWTGPQGPKGDQGVRGSYRYVKSYPPPTSQTDLAALTPQPLVGDEWVDTGTDGGPYVSYFS